MHQYDKTLNYSPDNSLSESQKKDEKYKNFFGILKAVSRDLNIDTVQKWDAKELELSALFDTKKTNIHSYFQDNFNTGGVFEQIDEIVKATNIYLEQPNPKLPLLTSISEYLDRIFRILGLDYNE